ncbi:CATRA system-associated protein [Streptomyces specialis]|uniref:CATRA system-associated protein n=1 Tax=Streptomyces specialis TaxID=498367 RepID=UPI00073F18CD|nr:CATRA system-associated protein [Streptomyces specialis]
MEASEERATAGSGRPPLWTETLDAVLGLVRDMPEWTLTEDRWTWAGDRLDAVGAAVTAGDLAALQQALAGLMVLDDSRFKPLGTAPRVPIPPRVRERVGPTADQVADARDEPPQAPEEHAPAPGDKR